MNEGRKKIPAKVLCWFPLKPILQRLFLSSKKFSSMTWHEDGRTKDGFMRHPADSFARKYFDSQHPDFSCDPRNVRLGLASHGFNPFKTMSISHSTWPIVLIPYNLPPWMCMKQPNFILSLLIPGPKGPENKLDVYMQPLVEELKELWEIGVKTFDACKKESFQMHVVIMWTINDFPAYANLLGWSTKHRYACPCCGLKIVSHWLRYSRKFCYMCHRCWLEPNSNWRYNRGEFDGTQEFRAPPKLPNGASVVRQLEDHGIGNGSPWKKKSILFTLPYWQHNVLRHILDVMHIEKNVCDNIIGTLLHLDGKSKDNDKARYDLVDMNIRSQLHPTMHPSKEFLPIAIKGCLPNKVSLAICDLCHLFKELCGKVLNEHNLEHLENRIAKTLSQLEKIFPPSFPPSFFTIMVHLLIYLAYEAKVAGPVHYRWMYPIESHLFVIEHIQRDLLNPRGRPLGRKCKVGFNVKKRKRASRISLDKKTLLQAHRYVLFNSHNIDPFQKEHIYLIRRRNRRLSSYEVDKIHGQSFSDWFRERVSRLEEQGSALVTNDIKWLARGPLETVRKYSVYIINGVRFHTKKRERGLKTQNSGIVVTVKTKSYDSSRDKHPKEGQINYYGALTDIIQLDYSGKYKALLLFKRTPVLTYSVYIINGVRFHTKKRERGLKTQNSGIVVTVKTKSYDSSRDKHPKEGQINYYGALTDIIQLDYSGKYKALLLFKCDWVDINKGCRIDNLGMTLVNFNYLQHTRNDVCDDPFILASQAKKIFYVENRTQNDWFVVVHAKVRDVYDLGDELSNDVDQVNEQVLQDINDNDLIRLEVDDNHDIMEVTISIESILQND
ncbi:uncharacterized protein [Cicer arietinum]|uniref:uncharacterized protein n=1 Tax=Cicer arietinum TaxID=3827 RepID=UPI00032A941B